MEQKQLDELLSKMTIEEKIGQMTQLAGYLYEKSKSDITGPLAEMNVPAYLDATHGSIVGSFGAETIKEIQKNYLEKSRLKIPLLFMADVIHGYRTIFPIPLAIGSTWNTELAKKSAEVAAQEAAVSGINVTFSPMIDLVRDSRWGRVMESTGEDSFLNSQFARAFVNGYQGNDLAKEHSRIACCAKHFIGYGASEAGREYNTVDISPKELKESYLPSFTAAIDAGVEMIMTAFNPINGIPMTGNSNLTNKLLRKELGYDGVVISDWNSMGELVTNGVAEDKVEAAKMGIKASVDIEMMTFCYAEGLPKLLENGIVKMEEINSSVMRILKLKNKLGLFENPYRLLSEDGEKKILFSEKNRKICKEVADESIILLKNKETLPLNRKQKIALIGPFSNNSNVLGVWSWRGEVSEASQLYDALSRKVIPENLETVQGCEIDNENNEMLAKAIEIAKGSDVVVLALGEHAKMSGEASSRSNTSLPKAQLELIEQIKKVSKKLVVILFNGRPLVLEGVIEECDALLEAWFLGSESGNAIADVLFGDVNPSGKTTMSFPQNVGQIPVYYNHYNTGRPYVSGSDEKWVSRYLDIPNVPTVPFGFGLSYSDYSYSEIELSSNQFDEDTPIFVSVVVSNVGKYSGKEIVQFYVQDVVGEVIRPVKELKGFKKIHLNPGEKEKVTFELNEKMVRYVHSNLDVCSDAGEFRVYIGSSSDCYNVATVRLNKK